MMNKMETLYKVGGCVRDMLMGIEPSDIDYLVVGSTPQEMLARGFQKVGKDFPVFIHPETGEEYALARKEKKNGVGYHGFEFDIENVSLEDDLYRRDFTMNAMALGMNGVLHDPYNGQDDIKNKVIRHVSEAFSEDPLRVLRAGRFAARYGFTIHESTMEEIKKVVSSGELKTISKDRIWLETQKALREDNPLPYFELLLEVGAWEQCFNFECTIPTELWYDSYFYKLLMCVGRSQITKTIASEMRMSNIEYDMIQFMKSVGYRCDYSSRKPEDRLEFINRLSRTFNPELVFDTFLVFTGIYFIQYEKTILKRDMDRLKAIKWEDEFLKNGIQKSEIKEFVKKKSIEVLS